MLQIDDSLFSSQIEEIKDTLSYIVSNTDPVTNLDGYIRLSEGQVAVAALAFSIIAAVFGILDFIYQKRSARYLEIANRRRPSLYPIVRRLYENSIRLQIIYEYDSDYNMSYTAEQKQSEEKRSSSKRHYFYSFYPSENILCQMQLPEDLIILEKYEIYANDDIYNLAFTIMDDVVQYNNGIDIAIRHIQSGATENKIRSDRDNLLGISRKLIRELLYLDELVWKNDRPWYLRWKKNNDKSRLEKSMAYFIAARFFANLNTITPDLIMADPFFNIATNVIEFTTPLGLKDMQKKRTALSKQKTKRLFNPEQAMLTHLNMAIRCINSIKNRKKDNCDVSVKRKKARMYNFAYFVHKRKTKPVEMLFNDIPLKENVETCFGNIYTSIRAQIDDELLDMEQIVRYDTLLQIATEKHTLFLNSSKHAYDNEKRRIKKKEIWNMEKAKQNKAANI